VIEGWNFFYVIIAAASCACWSSI